MLDDSTKYEILYQPNFLHELDVNQLCLSILVVHRHIFTSARVWMMTEMFLDDRVSNRDIRPLAICMLAERGY
jgi:hypothetical protein